MGQFYLLSEPKKQTGKTIYHGTTKFLLPCDIDGLIPVQIDCERDRADAFFVTDVLDDHTLADPS